MKILEGETSFRVIGGSTGIISYNLQQ